MQDVLELNTKNIFDPKTAKTGFWDLKSSFRQFLPKTQEAISHES